MAPEHVPAPAGTDLARLEERALAALDVDRMVTDLVELIRIPSVSGTEGEVDVQHYAAHLLDEMGLGVDLWEIDLDDLTSRPDFPGVEVERERALGLVGVSSAAATPALVLQGHLDVVPAGEPTGWDTDPWGGAVRDGSVWGRGACDMKGGVAVNIAVARAVAGLGLEAPLAVHCVTGEEDGGLGGYATLQRGHHGEACVITEPTDGDIVIANAGALTFRIEVPGRSAHGALRLGGQSAFESFLPVHAALVDLETERNADPDPIFSHSPLPYGLSFGLLHAGDWSSSVPDRLVAEGRYGVILGEDPAQARAAFEQRIAEVAAADPWLRDNPPVVTWPGGQFASGRMPEGHPLLGEMQSAMRDSDLAVPEPIGMVYGSDLRLYNGAGVPTLHFGPGDPAYAHAPDERIDIDELVGVARALTRLAVRRCAVASAG